MLFVSKAMVLASTYLLLAFASLSVPAAMRVLLILACAAAVCSAQQRPACKKPMVRGGEAGEDKTQEERLRREANRRQRRDTEKQAAREKES